MIYAPHDKCLHSDNFSLQFANTRTYRQTTTPQFVNLNLTFTPTRRGTFQKESEEAANIASTHVSNISGHCDYIFTYSTTVSFSTTWKRYHCNEMATAALLACRKALPALQRGLYGSATGLPLLSNKAVITTQGDPYRNETATFPDKISNQKQEEISFWKSREGLTGTSRHKKACRTDGKQKEKLIKWA